MGKHREKAVEALELRQELTPKDSSGMHYIKPGSQNRKKGYKRKAYRRGS